MFVGEYRLIIDDKGRVTLPSKYRRELEEGIVITRGFDGCLSIYPKDEFEKLAETIKTLSANTADARNYKRYWYGRANDVTPDKQGRVVIPPLLRQFANLEPEVVVVGLDNHMEVWNANAWDEFQIQLERTGAEIAEGFGNLVI